MDLPVEIWYPAISTRCSRRSFETKPVEEAKLSRLQRVCGEFRPFPEARCELVRYSPPGVYRGILGSYGRITGAAHYLAFIGDMNSQRVQECMGYTGEGLILEATSLGLGTCWVGGFFRPDVVSGRIRLAKSEKVLAISPLGYVKTRQSFTDITFKSFIRSRHRKPLQDLVQGGVAVDRTTRQGLEAARLAPSAVNRQPWRFRVETSGVFIAADMDEKDAKISRRLDCGIAMLHFEIGVRAAGLSGAWEFLEPPDVAGFHMRSGQ